MTKDRKKFILSATVSNELDARGVTVEPEIYVEIVELLLEAGLGDTSGRVIDFGVFNEILNQLEDNGII